jgi:hypothetical protein
MIYENFDTKMQHNSEETREMKILDITDREFKVNRVVQIRAIHSRES